MRKIIIICTIVIAFSCKSHQERNIEKARVAVKTYLTDKAFKNNGVFDIMQLDFIKFDTTDRRFLDSMKFNNVRELYNAKSALVELIVEQVKNYNNTARLYKEISSYASVTVYVEKARQASKDAEIGISELNTLKHQMELYDSLIKSNKNPEKIYKSYFLLKGVYTESDSAHNYLDTSMYLFDSKLKIITE